MEKVIIVVFSIIAICALLVIGYILIYNKLQKRVVRINEAEAEIDETLRKRLDILTNMENEINNLTDLKEDNFKNFKTDFMSNFDVDRKLSKITETFRKIREDYPDKLDTDSYRKMSTELKIVEEKSVAAKAYYNKHTTSLNMLVKKFPSNIIARIHKIDERSYFDNKNMNDNDILDFKL